GGDEFLIVLNNCNSEDAFQLAERIRTAVEEDLLAVLDDEVTITVSVGIATACQEDSNALDLIGKADTALYEAKKDGGNKVRVAEEKPSANLKLMGEGENAGRFTD
ncbi:TPA: GGDEF domain-containing protein, partial [Candidatus Poribacteria bacterium]|nr:GGDEF domain-containing protein [Candidatus Poribacteria bacterium]